MRVGLKVKSLAQKRCWTPEDEIGFNMRKGGALVGNHKCTITKVLCEYVDRGERS